MNSSLRHGVMVSATSLGLAASHQIGAHAARQATAGQEGSVRLHGAKSAGFRRPSGLRVAVRRQEPEGLGRQSEILARRERGHRRGVDADEPQRQQLHRLSGPRGERLHAEVRDQGRGRVVEAACSTAARPGVPWLASIAPNVTANVGPVNLELDDDRSAGRFLAERGVHGPVLFRERADADPRLAGSGRRRLWCREQDTDGHDRRSPGVGRPRPA